MLFVVTDWSWCVCAVRVSYYVRNELAIRNKVGVPPVSVLCQQAPRPKSCGKCPNTRSLSARRGRSGQCRSAGLAVVFQPPAAAEYRKAGEWFDDPDIYHWFGANLRRMRELRVRPAAEILASTNSFNWRRCAAVQHFQASCACLLYRLIAIKNSLARCRNHITYITTYRTQSCAF
jgi:hypothetical protein